jgi:hypothetical protein
MPTPVTFTGTPGVTLPTYDSDWVKVTDGGAISGDWRINGDGNKVKRGTANQNGMAVYKAADSIPSSPNYIVSATWHTINNQNFERVGVMGRASDTTRNGYVLRVTNASPATLALMEAVGGSPTIIVSTTYSNPNGTARRFGLVMDGDQISVIDRDNNDAVILGPVTDTTHAGAGHIGLWFTTDSTSVADAAAGMQIDDLDIEYLSAPFVYESNPESAGVAAAILTTGIQLVSGAIASAAAVAVLTTASAAMAASAGSFSDAGASLTTGIVLQASAQGEGSAVAALPSVTTTLEAGFAGANANTTLSVINNASSDTPTAVIRVRSPEDSEWQQALYKLVGVRNKVIANEWLLVEKEDADSYLGTWEGPWFSFDGLSWTNQPEWQQVAGDRMSFAVDCGANDEVWIASLPPWTQDTVLAWINGLAAAHPTRIKSNLPSHVAHGGDPYVCALSGTGVDENGRSVSNLPLIAFVISDDELGVPEEKRWIELWAGVHPGEWNGGLQVRGAVNEILNGIHSSALLSRFVFVIRPIMSPKGSRLGFRRNEAAASFINNLDANREWADGDTSLATVVQWQGILDVDHGVNHASRVVGFMDFHDGKNVSQTAWFVYQPGSAIAAAFLALVQAENASINSVESTVTGTTSSYWESKGLAFTWTCECADEKSTAAQVEAFGAAYMRALKTADDAGLLPQFHTLTCTSSSGSDALAALTTSISLQVNAQAESSAYAVLLAGADITAAAVSYSEAQAALTASVMLQLVSSSNGVASALLTAEMPLVAAASSVSMVSAELQAGAAPFECEAGALSVSVAALTTAIQLTASGYSASTAVAYMNEASSVTPPPARRRLVLTSESRRLHL